ncbi:MAG: ABC-F family ATP-binding cassette domain-containing protein [Pseudomonadota bacterium]
MLRIDDITFTLEGRPLFEGASAVIPTGHTVGVVGRNGAGKTTLFRLIRGEWTLDGGDISMPRGSRVGGVAQEVPAGPDALIDIVLAADTERAALMAEAETAADPGRIADIQTRLADIEAHSAEARAATILSGLGFDAQAQARAASEFSGGWRMRVALAAVLFSAPDLLLLDEPTNYLDLEGTIWLESYVARYPHTALIISHDRGLLDRAVKSILHVDRGKLALYQGNYATFDAQRRERLAQEASAAKRIAERRAHMQSFVDRFRAKATKARQAQSRLKMIEKLGDVVQTPEERVAAFAFPEPEQLSPPIIRLDRASVGYGGTPILKNLDLRIDEDDRIALLGANGQGKSTLSKLIAERLEESDGTITRARKLRIGFFAQHQLEELNADETPLQHLRRHLHDLAPAKLRARLAAGGIGAEIAEVEVQRLSGGQKARLAMLLCTLDAPHLLILDEPTNHLDIESRAALVEALAAYSGAVILVSHDPDLVNATADRLWLVKDGKVAPFEGDMEAYKALLLSERGGVREAKPKPTKPKTSGAEKRRALAPLKAELSKAEARVAKLEEMRDEIDRRLGNPDLYLDEGFEKLEQLQRKRAEVLAALERAEGIWMTVQEKLDRAEGAA